MKKLTKVSLLLATVLALSACSNAADSTSSSGDVPAFPSLISDSDVAELTETPELSDFTNGKWKLQSYATITDPNNFTTSYSISNYEQLKKTLTEAEQKELDSWKFVPEWAKNDQSSVYFHFPFEKRLWVINIDFNKVKDNPTENNAFNVNKLVIDDRIKITNALYSKLTHSDKSFTWNDNIATRQYSYTTIEGWMLQSYFNPIMNNLTNYSWKANSDKTKFYAEKDDTKYYLIKE